MTDTVRTLAALQVLLADNSVGAISPQDVRDFLVSVFPTGHHRSLSITYISGTGTEGSDSEAAVTKTLVLPAATLAAVGDRMRVRTYWRGDNGAAITGTVKVNGVTISDTTDAGAATLQLNEAWLHYLDATHANVIENEAGGLGSRSAANVAGFDWANSQNITFEQDAANNNHTVLYAMIVDKFPAG